jgi:hypothetical protein
MSILNNILGSIFGGAQAQPDASKQQGGAMSRNPSFQGTAPGRQQSDSPAQQAPQGHRGPGNIPFAPQHAQAHVDIEPLLDRMAAQKNQKLDWRHSIVDLMKLLDLDSSLAARKELAKELHYTGDMNNSAEMNIWLHKQVMQKLEENGGKVPESLKH